MIFKTTNLLPLALLFIFSSCSKVQESIQRDLFITPAGVEFTIPVIPVTTSGSAFGQFDIKNLDLDALIKEKDSKFGINNIKAIKLKDFKIELLGDNGLPLEPNDEPDPDDEPDNEQKADAGQKIDKDNNIANIENVSVTIQASEQIPAVIASASPTDTESATLIIPVSGGTELKSFLNTTPFNYKLTGKARRQITKELKARATITYTVTVGL